VQQARGWRSLGRVAWQLLTDDPAERALFATLPAVLQQARTPAGPPNRRRLAERLVTPIGVFYLKSFRGTQWQNRLRFALTPPRARDDAERELRITAALRLAGQAAPRPIGYGSSHGISYYLCATLPGRSLTELVDDGALDGALHRRVAVHLGRLLQQGFDLPDLGLDHVYVAADGPAVTIGVLDLHNGSMRPAGPARLRTLRRVLRRCHRAVRGLGLPLAVALRFAVRFVRAAGHGAGTLRRLARRLPPWPSWHRYEAAGKSAAYAERNPTRAAREAELLAAVWPGRPGEVVLDLPSGAGRLLPLLVGRFGHRVVAADGALAMLRLVQRTPSPPPCAAGDALAMPFGDRSCDGVVMFRFLHHLPPDAAKAAIQEACRVAERFVVVSFFHRCSAHQAQRLLHQVAGHPRTRFPTTLARLRGLFRRHGFVLHAHAAELPFLRDLWLASFVRRGPQ
jgi:SAM-dependent methyltransferase